MKPIRDFLRKLVSFLPGKFRISKASFSWQNVLLALAILAIPVFGYSLWRVNVTAPGLDDALKRFPSGLGTAVSGELRSAPALAIRKENDSFVVTDDDSTGISVEYPNRQEGDKKDEPKKDTLRLSFPSDYSKPLEVDLGQGKKFTLTDRGASKGYRTELLSSSLSQPGQDSGLDDFARKRVAEMRDRSQKDQASQRDILSYRSTDSRKTILYSYRNDGASGAKKLKNWTIYAKGNGSEEEKYVLDGATAKINDSGDLDIFLKSEQQTKNDAATAQVDPNLLERARRTLEKENGSGAMDGNRPADLTIPKPYYVDKDGNHHGADWTVSDDGKTFSVSIGDASGRYPIALDPTLSFAAPGNSTGGKAISGTTAGDEFGYSMAAGDFNADGRTDLAVSAPGASSGTGKVYLFFNDALYPVMAASADVVISGTAAGTYFGSLLAVGDFNSDGKTDIAAASSRYWSSSDPVYIFYQRSIGGFVANLSASSADASIAFDYEEGSMTVGDFNADGKDDLAVGTSQANSQTGKVYIFYQNTAGGFTVSLSYTAANSTLTGGATNNLFGEYVATGDFNADGKDDIVVSAVAYPTANYRGRVYMFYQNSAGGFNASIAASAANVTITGENDSDYFGGDGTGDGTMSFKGMVVGDFNADGKDDLAVGARGYSSYDGRVYVFYQGSSGGFSVSAASAADVKIGRDDSSVFYGIGASLAAGDLNADGRTDLITGTKDTGSGSGVTYVFYNDGSYPANARNSDVIVTSNDEQGWPPSYVAGDFNADGKTDVTISAASYASVKGRVYVLYSQNGTVNTNASISGTATDQAFGATMATADFNRDGRDDLVVGDNGGHTYIFYNDGSTFPSTVAGADVTIANGYSDASSVATGDFNADGKPDIAIGESYTAIGRVALLYNDGSWPSGTDSADATIDNSTYGDWFGTGLVVGDFNNDGKDDLACSAVGYNASARAGRVYVFFQGVSWPASVASADAILTGTTAEDEFGTSTATGDFNADGKADLVVGASGYYVNHIDGHAYVFYGGSITTKNASAADIVLTGNSGESFGSSVAMGDFDADGKEDLAVGAGDEGDGYVHIFYSRGSSNPSTWVASAADVSIGDLGAYHEPRLLAGDFNSDGRTDLISTNLTYNAYYFSRAVIFYNDGSYPSSATGADVVIDSGEMIGSGFYGTALAAGDFNDDGRNDFVIGEPGLGANGVGQINFYTSRENFSWTTHVSGGAGSMNVAPGAGQEVRIVGEQVESAGFGFEMASGDFNADGKTDLAVSTPYYHTVDWPAVGRVYIFYDDGSIPSSATSADVVITGTQYFSYFGWALSSGDMNADGRTDLVVGTLGMAHVFYNDGSYPERQEDADLTITSGGSGFGSGVVTGDLDADGRTDLAVYDATYNNYAGEVDVFYNDGSWPTVQSGRDAAITGQNETDMFGENLEIGDFNADGKADLLVSASWYSAVEHEGRVYIFHGGSITTEGASGADVIVEGSDVGAYFGGTLVTGDFNADGRMDFATNNGCGDRGCIFMFYNDGSYPGYSDDADVSIVGSDLGVGLGVPLVTGDFNGDGRTDLAASTSDASVHIFHNDGSYPATEASSDVVIPNVMYWAGFAPGLGAGDFDADGRDDLAISNPAAAVNGVADAGAVSVYTFNDAKLSGTAGTGFGHAMTAGDFNADGKTDLAVSAPSYSSDAGRVYVFFSRGGGGAFAPSVTSADAVITGATAEYFGSALASADLNKDGKTDLVAGAHAYDSHSGRAYIFYGGSVTTENSSGADVVIAGDGADFGATVATGDFNADGWEDLAVASYANYAKGVLYLFWGDGSIPTSAATADASITGENNSDYLGISMVAGDLNADGKTDLAVGAQQYVTDNGGRIYIFFNDGTYPSLAVNADVKITGEVAGDYFGAGSNGADSLGTGDFNGDGKIDLVAGSINYNSASGRTYIFFNDGTYPSSAASADRTIDSASTYMFGNQFASGDFNADGRTDLAACGFYNTRIFYNDGSFPADDSQADFSIPDTVYGHATLAAGDFNSDGKTDLVIGHADDDYVSFVAMDAQTVESQPAARTRGTVKVRGNLRVR